MLEHTPMLDLFLSILPRQVSPLELRFHENLVKETYQNYFGTVVGTLFRDRQILFQIKKSTNYSMGILFWYNFNLWVHFQKAYFRVKYLKKSTLTLEMVNSLIMP